MNFLKYVEAIQKYTDESYVGYAMDLRFDVLDFIRKALKEKDMTQKTLAKKLFMKESQLTRILRAEANMTLETVARIYHAFGCKVTIREKYDIPEAIGMGQSYELQTIYTPQAKVKNEVAA